MHVRLTKACVAFAALALAGAACNVPGQAPAAGENPSGAAACPTAEEQAAPVCPSPGQPTGAGDDLRPVGFNEGLASLNSYRMTLVLDFTGPTPDDVTYTEVEVAYSLDDDARHTRTTRRTSTADSPELEESVSEEYQIGQVTCSLSSDGEADAEELSPLEREIRDLTVSLVEFRPLIEDPVFAGQETVNGVEAEHYTFHVSSLGSKSGAEVVHSDGEYWRAVDGHYLVRYLFSLEMRTAPEGDVEAEAVSAEISVELRDVNQPVEISMPASCSPGG